MKRLLIVVLATYGISVGVQAAPPGPLDGEDIPFDFAGAKLLGVQTNRTGVGDVTDLGNVKTYTQGTELDALYLAKDSQFLYVGLAGNQLEVGNPFIILIDNPFEFGQTELRAEGVGGPPFSLQLASREVTINTNGTPGDGSDDTYTVVADSGTLLPTCGDPGFTGWDYALAVDSAGGVMFAHQYILYGVQIGVADIEETCHYGNGRVSCDPTPENTGDAGLPIYAIRSFVAESPLEDGNEIFEGGDGSIGYQRGGFFNTNTTGVTEVDAAMANMTTTGVEIAIPLSRIGDSGLFGSETIHLMVLTMDMDEYEEYTVSGEYGSFMNQALPSLTGGSCDPPQALGMRPDLSVIASCLEVDLSTLGSIDTGAVLEGVIHPSDYATGAPVLTQQCPTSGGDQALDAIIFQPLQAGSELDALYADNDDDFLYLGLTGNVETGGPAINIFLDTDPGATNGDQVISDFTDFSLDGTYEAWDTATFTTNGTSFRVQSTDFGGGYEDIEPNLNAAGAVTLVLDVVVEPANQADVIRVLLTDTDGTERVYDFAVPGTGPQTLSKPLTDYAFDMQVGTTPGLDLANLDFFHLAGGFNNGDPGLVFDVSFDNLALIDEDEGQHVVTFNPTNIYETIQVEDFNYFNLGGAYSAWTGATFTSGATGFRVEATGGFGGGWFLFDSVTDLSRAISLEFDVTVNIADGARTVILVLADSDDTQLRWTWPSLAVGSHTLTATLAAGTTVAAGAIEGFDFSSVNAAHIQTSFINTDIVFENLAVAAAITGPAAMVGMGGDALANGPLDVLNNGRLIPDAALHYDYAYGVNIQFSPYLARVDYYDLINGTYALRGAVVPESGNSTLADDPGGMVASNPNGLELAINNQNTNGVIGCEDGEPCFLEDADAVAARAEQAVLGVEMAIPLADIGLSAEDLPRIIRVWTVAAGVKGYASDQSLPTMRNQSGEGNQISVPGNAPVDFTYPIGGPSLEASVSEFEFFAFEDFYGSWTDAVITSGADDLRIQDTSAGGGYVFLDPWVDATGASKLMLDVTMNAGNQTETLVVVLFDGDGTVLKYLFDGVPLTGDVTLIKDLRDVYNVEAVGAVPGLDLGNIGQFNLEGTWAYNLAFDVTYHRMALIGGTRNYEARAARVCLGTVEGDADCDGDNDLEDFALFQQCIGVEADPVLPMECEQLDLLKDRKVDSQDLAEFIGILEGP